MSQAVSGEFQAQAMSSSGRSERMDGSWPEFNQHSNWRVGTYRSGTGALGYIRSILLFHALLDVVHDPTPRGSEHPGFVVSFQLNPTCVIELKL